jgi:excisionase family DNA binding protein
MSKLKFSNKSIKPGVQCEPVQVPVFQSVVTMKVGEVTEFVQREVNKYLASLPFAQVQCITVQKAADLLECYADTVRVYIRSGQLTASRLGKDYRIRIIDLEEFVKKNQTKAIVRKMQHKQKKIS